MSVSNQHLELAEARRGAHGDGLVDASHSDAVARLAHVQQRVEGEHADRVRRLSLRDRVGVLLRFQGPGQPSVTHSGMTHVSV